MKKSILAIAVIAVLGLASCAEEDILDTNIDAIENPESTEGDDPNENGGQKPGG